MNLNQVTLPSIDVEKSIILFKAGENRKNPPWRIDI